MKPEDYTINVEMDVDTGSEESLSGGVRVKLILWKLQHQMHLLQSEILILTRGIVCLLSSAHSIAANCRGETELQELRRQIKEMHEEIQWQITQKEAELSRVERAYETTKKTHG